MTSLMLLGDVNLMNVEDPAVPFRRIGPELREADIVFANLECCLYRPPEGCPGGHTVEHEGFFADPEIAGEALADRRGRGGRHRQQRQLRQHGDPRLDRRTRPARDRPYRRRRGPRRGLGAGVVASGGMRVGFVQRSSVYWPTNHEATATGAGIAVLRGHTAYQVPAHKTRPEIPPMNRPGVPPIVVTWADRAYLKSFTDQIAALRRDTDFVVASCHWGLGEEVLDYMTEIAHAAIDSGADIVVGHGPHYSLPVEVYQSKPIFYGLGSFSFHTGHGGRRHGDWIGMMARIEAGPAGIVSKAARFRFVRHNAANETVPCALAAEGATFDRLAERGARLDTKLIPEGDWVRVAL